MAELSVSIADGRRPVTGTGHRITPERLAERSPPSSLGADRSCSSDPAARAGPPGVKPFYLLITNI
jgi:hypothetical protein